MIEVVELKGALQTLSKVTWVCEANSNWCKWACNLHSCCCSTLVFGGFESPIIGFVALTGLASDFFAGRHWQKENFRPPAFYISILDGKFKILDHIFSHKLLNMVNMVMHNPKSVMHYAKWECMHKFLCPTLVPASGHALSEVMHD